MSDLFFHQNWNFDGFCKNLLQTKSVLIASLNFLSLMVLWIRRRHRKESTYSTTCQKKGICSDSNWRAQPVRKSLETISGVILNQLQPKFAAKTVENEKLWLKAMYRLVLTGLSLFNSFFFSNMLKKNNWPTITNSILKIFPKFQDLTFDFPDDDEMAHLGLKDLFRISSSHTSLFWGLRPALWALSRNCWRQNNQTPNSLQSMSYVMTGLPQEYLFFFFDFDILL